MYKTKNWNGVHLVFPTAAFEGLCIYMYVLMCSGVRVNTSIPIVIPICIHTSPVKSKNLNSIQLNFIWVLMELNTRTATLSCNSDYTKKKMTGRDYEDKRHPFDVL